MTHHPGNYIGNHSGIDISTRTLVVAELRILAAKMQDLGDRAVITARADQIENAGAWRWDCGVKLGKPHNNECTECTARRQSANA